MHNVPLCRSSALIPHTMARNESYIVNALAYSGLRAVGTILQTFPVDRNMAALGAIGDLWYKRDSRRRDRTAGNIRRSLPHLNNDEVQELTRLSMRHLLQLFIVEVQMTPRLITPTTWQNHVTFGHLGRAIEILSSPKPSIFITGHCGNFELLGFTLATAGFPLTALARPLDLPRINDYVMGIREHRGMSIMTKFGAMEQLPKLLEDGKRIAFIADQNAGDKGMFVPFFGRLASAYKSIGLLAMRFNTPIICGLARRVMPNQFHYQINVEHIIEPEDWANQPDPLYYITARYTKAIEDMVRRAPDQYFWIHRRWKSRPRHERLGKAFPKSLREKLSQLPWLDDAQVQHIITASDEESANPTTP